MGGDSVLPAFTFIISNTTDVAVAPTAGPVYRALPTRSGEGVGSGKAYATLPVTHVTAPGLQKYAVVSSSIQVKPSAATTGATPFVSAAPRVTRHIGYLPHQQARRSPPRAHATSAPPAAAASAASQSDVMKVSKLLPAEAAVAVQQVSGKQLCLHLRPSCSTSWHFDALLFSLP